MASVDEQSKKRLTESLNKLVTFGANPRDRLAWDNARIALGELGSISGGLLANRPQEDAALTSALTELDGFADVLRYSPGLDDARRRFEEVRAVSKCRSATRNTESRDCSVWPSDSQLLSCSSGTDQTQPDSFTWRLGSGKH